jgi:hypothetical protein
MSTLRRALELRNWWTCVRYACQRSALLVLAVKASLADAQGAGDALDVVEPRRAPICFALGPLILKPLYWTGCATPWS